MPTKEDLDKELADFLRRETESEREGFTKRALHSGMKALDSRFADHEKKDDDRHDETMQAIYGMQARISAVEVETRSNKSDIAELKPNVRDAISSVHDFEVEHLTKDRDEAKAKNKETLDIVKQVAIYTACAVIGVVVTYFAMRLGIAH